MMDFHAFNNQGPDEELVELTQQQPLQVTGNDIHFQIYPASHIELIHGRCL